MTVRKALMRLRISFLERGNRKRMATADEIIATGAQVVFPALGLAEPLTPQHCNGRASMVGRTLADARAIAAG